MWRAWRATRCQFMLKPGRWRANYTTSTSCASTAVAPITDRSISNDSRSPGVRFLLYAGALVARGPHHYRLLLRAGAGDRDVPEGASQHRRRLLHGRTRDDGLGGRAGVPVGEPGIARTDGLGGQRL